MEEEKFIDPDKMPLHTRNDYVRRNANVALDHALCGRCDGTGNELLSMYLECRACTGDGISRGNEVEIAKIHGD